MIERLVDRYVRRKIRFHRTPLDRYVLRVARTTKEYDDAFGLLHAAYAYQGLEGVRESRLRIQKQHLLEQAVVIVAYEGDRIVGTVTATADSPAGLPLDKDYPEELEALRDEGARIVEFGSLAVLQRCWHTGVSDLLSLAAHRVARGILGGTHGVLGANPRAYPMYRAVYNFRPLGPAKSHAELAAPVLGLVHDLATLEVHLRKHFRKPMASGWLAADHFDGKPLPACMQIPEHRGDSAFGRWKLPRDVFREIFVNRSTALMDLDEATYAQLSQQRTHDTLSAGPGVRVAARQGAMRVESMPRELSFP